MAENGLLSPGNAESIFYRIEAKLKKKQLELEEVNSSPVVTRLQNIGFSDDRHITYLCITFENKQALLLPVCEPKNISFYEHHVYIYITNDRVFIEIYDKRKRSANKWSIRIK